MKRIPIVRGSLAGFLFTVTFALAELQPVAPDQLAGHGVPSASALELLPRGALLHMQLNGLLPVVEGLEGILKAAAPMKALPPDAQNLLQTPNPLLALVGFQNFGAPLDETQVAERFGISPRETATVSLYVGDPRRMFVISLPIARTEALAGLLTGILQPQQVEKVQLGEGAGLRIVPREGPVPELYLTCSEKRAFLCGDRGLAQALHALPGGERMGADEFLTRAMAETASQHLAVVCDPRMIKPIVLQLGQLQPIGMMLLRQKKQEFLKQLPREARQQMEQQFRAQFGVENLEQFTEYLDAVVDVTSRQLLDYVTNQMLAFEGICLDARLDAQFPGMSLRLYSQKFQSDSSTAALPKQDLVKALRWVGSDFSSIAATGRRPAPQAAPGLRKWVEAVREQFAAKGLKSSWFDRFATLLAETQAVEPMESRVPWTLSVNAPVDPQPDLAKAPSLTAYFRDLHFPVRRTVKIVPEATQAFFERALEAETEVRNRNRELAVEFNRQTARQEPWFDHQNRLSALDLDSGIRRLVMESAWRTHGGLFGYDQHELVNRRWFYARQVNGYLVYHQGGSNADWLRSLDDAPEGELTPAVRKLLERTPGDVNQFEIHRTLQVLPAFVDWLAALENRIHADLEAYLVKARKVVAEASSPDEARSQLASLPMPELLYAVNRAPASGEVYLTLPGNLRFPRERVVPFIQEILAGYSQAASDVGGSLCYSRVSNGVCQVTVLQSTEALTRLISTVGDTLAEKYLASPERLQQLNRAVWSGEDGNPEAFEQVLVANPFWNFIPRPAPKTVSKPGRAVPERSAQAGDELIDLSAHYNGLLDETWHAGGVENNTLANLPQGVQEFGGLPFDVRGVVQLYGRDAAEQLSVKFPKAVEGIVVGRKASKLGFLHGCGWASERGTVVAKYVVHYANGESREIPVTYGEDVRDWWSNDPDSGGSLKPAWSGENTAISGGPPKSIYVKIWENPLPDVEIRAVDYVSTQSNSAPFLIALTAR